MSEVPGFDLGSEHQEILQHADRFAREQLYPLQPRMDDEEWWPDDLFKKFAEVGYLGITAPLECGGAAMDLFTSALVAQAVAKWNPAAMLSWGAHENLCLNNILRNANDAQLAKYVPALCSGASVGALGLTEPGAGSDAVTGMKTAARRQGDHYLLSGTKIYITNGPIADVLLVYAKTDPARGAHGISAFIVERGFPGFSVAQKLSKMGYRGSPTGELVFDNCKVPVENLVGGENQGIAVVMSGLDIERALFSVAAVGIAQRALELAVDYARQRQQFGQPIASFQMIQAKLADMYVGLESMTCLAYKAAAACNTVEAGEGGRGELHKLTAAALLNSATTCSRILDEAVQIHGGYGYMWDTEINRLYRAGKLMDIGAGTNEVRRLIISDELLK